MVLACLCGEGPYNAMTAVLPVTETDRFSNGPCRNDIVGTVTTPAQRQWVRTVFLLSVFFPAALPLPFLSFGKFAAKIGDDMWKAAAVVVAAVALAVEAKEDAFTYR